MALGNSILLSSVFLSIVILFAVTRDRWNWKRISRWVVLLPVGLAMVSAAGLYLYTRIEERPKRQEEFFDIPLRATIADVKFIKGEPSTKEGDDRWIYKVGSSTEKDEAVYLVQFKNGRVRFVLYTATQSQIVNPYLLGFTLGANYQRVKERLGTPSNTTVSADDLDRIFSYDKHNVFFSFRQSAAIAYGIFDPQEGPIRFSAEKAAGDKGSK